MKEPAAAPEVRRPSAPLRDTSRSLPIALLRARERVMGPIRAKLADVGVTEQQWRVLRVLDEGGPLDPTAIAERACLLAPSLTRIARTLEAKGLITRAPHESDGRKVRIDISDEGRALIAAAAPRSNLIFAELEAAYGAEKLERLLDLLEDLVATDL